MKRQKPIDPSKPWPNPRMEIYIQAVFKGSSQHKAYLKAFPKSIHWKSAVVDVRASELNRKVLVRIQWLQSQASDVSVISVLKRKQILSKIAEASVSDFMTCGADGVVVDVGPENIRSPALESVKSRFLLSGEGDGRQDAMITSVKTRNPIEAIGELNKMEHVYSDEKPTGPLIVLNMGPTPKPLPENLKKH